MDKPFKTYNQQMKYLRETKNIECSGSQHKSILITCGYFNLINGYKTPFIIRTDSSGNHQYIGGTTIDHFKAVKDFDDELRYIILKYITHCEEEIRTLAGHKFDYLNNDGETTWFQIESFNPDISAQNKIKVIAKCFTEIDKSKQPYVQHYLNEHSSVPTWIFTKVINFSTFIEFLKICKPGVINSLCALYSIYDLDGNVNPKLLISMLHWIRKIRNACAHNERIYGITRENGRVNAPFAYFLKKPKIYTQHRFQKLVDLIIYLRYFLNNHDYLKFISDIQQSFFKLQGLLNPNAFQKVRADTGIRNIAILDELAAIKKEINYNKFEKL